MYFHLGRLGPTDVQSMVNRELAVGLSVRRVDDVRGFFRCALNEASGGDSWAATWLVRTPKGPRHEIHLLGPEGTRRVLDAVHEDRRRPFTS